GGGAGEVPSGCVQGGLQRVGLWLFRRSDGGGGAPAGGKLELEVGRRELVAFGEQDRSLDDVAELADVSGPLVGQHGVLGVGRQALRGQPILRADAPQEV